MLENKKKFKVSVKFSSLPEEKKKKIMFEVFDILLIKKKFIFGMPCIMP